jgi:hypothetical protein
MVGMRRVEMDDFTTIRKSLRKLGMIAHVHLYLRMNIKQHFHSVDVLGSCVQKLYNGFYDIAFVVERGEAYNISLT